VPNDVLGDSSHATPIAHSSGITRHRTSSYPWGFPFQRPTVELLTILAIHALSLSDGKTAHQHDPQHTAALGKIRCTARHLSNVGPARSVAVDSRGSSLRHEVVMPYPDMRCSLSQLLAHATVYARQ
jgi:hypothetical protein